MVKTKSMIKFGVRRGIREEDEFEDGLNNWWYALKMVSGYMIFTFDYSFSYILSKYCFVFLYLFIIKLELFFEIIISMI